MNQLFDSEDYKKINLTSPSFLGKKISAVRADPADYYRLLDFVKNQRYPQNYNYLVFVLENLLNRGDNQESVNNTILLADNEIIGFECHRVFLNHYVWAQGATVDSRFRDLGWGKRLHEIGPEIARKNNLNLLRTRAFPFTMSYLRELGYSELQTWYFLGYKADRFQNSDSKFAGIRPAVDSDYKQVEQFLFQSSYFILSERMYAEDITWYPLDRPWLEELIRKGKILLNKDESGIKGLAIINKNSLINHSPNESSIVEIGYFDGDWTPILDFIEKKYKPGFIRIYSADGVPLNCLPARIKKIYFVADLHGVLYGGLNSRAISEEEAVSTVATIMQKRVNN